MAKKNNKKVKKHFKVEQPLVKVKADDVDNFKCPNCRADNFQLKAKKGYEMVVECISCGEMYEIEFDDECDGECEIEKE